MDFSMPRSWTKDKFIWKSNHNLERNCFVHNFLFIGTIFILPLNSKRASWCGDLPPGVGAQTRPFDLCARKPWQGTFASLLVFVCRYPPLISEGGVQINFPINQKMPLELVGFEPGAAAWQTALLTRFDRYSGHNSKPENWTKQSIVHISSVASQLNNWKCTFPSFYGTLIMTSIKKKNFLRDVIYMFSYHLNT